MRRLLYSIIDILAVGPAVMAGILLRAVRTVGLEGLPLVRSGLFAVGLLPVRRHYYEHFPDQSRAPSTQRLKAIDWREASQWALIDGLEGTDELHSLPGRTIGGRQFSVDNTNFRGGDIDILYGILRHLKPSRVVEVGSGHSTLVAAQALCANAAAGKQCKHLCIEPYEMPWLESIGVQVIRSRVETLAPSFFSELQSGDLLFIDSSHVVRAGGDVLYLVQEILPCLAPGVIVHFHDIFSPADYPSQWIDEKALLWNEQYLLEAFLLHNGDWEILLAANFLRHQDFHRLAAKCPLLESDGEPGSFYIRRRCH